MLSNQERFLKKIHLTCCIIFCTILKKRMPGLERERFIADTLYKKLWKHDNNAMSILDVAFFYVFTYVLNRMLGDASLEKCWETFYKEVFLCLAEVMKKD